MHQKKFRWFPSEKTRADFPWPIWAVGWLAVFKAIIWLGYQPILPDAALNLLGYKYVLGLAPLIIFGVGIWNLRRWAAWGLIAVAAANLVFFFLNPQLLSAFWVKSGVLLYSAFLSLIVYLCDGPLGDILILFAAPVMLKYTLKDRPAVA